MALIQVLVLMCSLAQLLRGDVVQYPGLPQFLPLLYWVLSFIILELFFLFLWSYNI